MSFFHRLESSLDSLVPPWVILLIGLGLGQSNVFFHTLHWCEQHAESILVPTYTLLVILYLGYVALHPYWQPLLEMMNGFRQQYRQSNNNSSRQSQRPPVEYIDTTTRSTVDPANDGTDTDTSNQPINLSGSYKLISNDNFEAFLQAQGVPWALRRAANSARPTHCIIHRGNHLTIKIQGPLVSQTSYLINGPAVETNVRGRIFADKVTYIYENGNDDNNNDSNSNNNNKDSDTVCRGILVSKKAITNNYDVTVKRELSDDKNFIYMTSTAHFSDERGNIESKQVFERTE